MVIEKKPEEKQELNLGNLVKNLSSSFNTLQKSFFKNIQAKVGFKEIKTYQQVSKSVFFEIFNDLNGKQTLIFKKKN